MQFLRCFGPYTVFDFVFLLFWFYGSFGPLCFLWCFGRYTFVDFVFLLFWFFGCFGPLYLALFPKLSFLTFFTSVYFYLFGQKKKRSNFTRLVLLFYKSKKCNISHYNKSSLISITVYSKKKKKKRNDGTP